MAVSDEPKKPAVSIQISYADAVAWVKANWLRYWEKGFYAVMILAAAGLRFWDLGLRAISHDESSHATYSWYLYNGGGYTHDPMMHGPLKFFSVAFIWKGLAFLSTAPFLTNWAHWGPSDYTVRILPAIFGTALVGLPYFFRGYLGRAGALFAALFLAFSPILLFFSRYIRDDVLIAFFTLALVICFWRYLSERRTLYLFLIAGLLALSFTTMEATFLIAGLFLLYLDLLVAWDFSTQLQERWEGKTAVPEESPDAKPVRGSRKKETPPLVQTRETTFMRWALAFVCIMPIAWLIAITWPLTEKLRARWKLDRWPASADLLIIVGTLAGVQFAATVQLIPFIGDKGYYKDIGGAENTLMKLTVFIFLTISAYIGLLWRPKTWLIAAGIFYTIFVLLFTTFFTNMGGFWSGIWGSLDYWLQQQGVARGSQPVYYPLMILSMYEFLPLVFAVIGAAWLLLRRQFLASLLAILAVCALAFAYFTLHASLLGMVPVLVILGVVLFLLRQDLFTSFLVFWAAGSLIEVMTAGEKMPQHPIYVVIPLVLLAGKSLNVLYERFRVSLPFRWRSPETLVILAAVAGALSMIIFWLTAFSSVGAVLAVILGVAAAGLIALAFRLQGRLLGAQTAAALLIPALFVFTVRDTIRASFDLGTWPREILSYADVSPDIPWARDQLAQLGKNSKLGTTYPVVVDNEIAWPFVWYLRDYKPQWASDSMAPPTAGSLVILKEDHKSWMDPYLDQYQDPVPIRHLWWFGDGPQFYEGVTAGGFIKDLHDPSVWNVWRNYFVWREVPWAPPPDDALVYIPKQLATTGGAPLTPPPPIPTVSVPAASVTTIGDGQLEEPTDVTVDASGNVYVSDSKNNRVQIFGSDGKLLRTLQPTDANAWNQPWSVAVGADGSVYVSDTWNMRVSKYDANSSLLWQSPSTVGFYGPRDILALPDGSVLVADTGNKRIVKLSPYGDIVTSYGTAGNGQGQFNEPVGLALGPNGDIYVADTWNGRVQHFDSNLKYLSEFAVKGWGSQEVTAKPFLVVLPDGRVIVSNPANARIELYDLQGKAVAAWELPNASNGTKARPVGMALDSQGFLYVADITGNRIFKLPVAGLTGP
jgi:predicted membrane-bound mannosyltransferase/DNA-binding beta-propeller fold protein YncE